LYKNEYWKKQGKLSDDEFFYIIDKWIKLCYNLYCEEQIK